MSTYPAPDLLRLWSLGEVTPEQTISHLVQQLVTITQRLTEVEKRLRQLEQQTPRQAETRTRLTRGPEGWSGECSVLASIDDLGRRTKKSSSGVSS